MFAGLPDPERLVRDQERLLMTLGVDHPRFAPALPARWARSSGRAAGHLEAAEAVGRDAFDRLAPGSPEWRGAGEELALTLLAAGELDGPRRCCWTSTNALVTPARPACARSSHAPAATSGAH